MDKTKEKKNLKSIYKGVNFNKRSELWESSFTVKGERYYCGGWDTDHQAVRARDKRILSEGFDVPRQVLFPSSETKN
jgi:hypothetical protein